MATPLDKTDPDALLALLRGNREVYRAAGGRWYVTHGGGEWPQRTVLELMARGQLRALPNVETAVFALETEDERLKREDAERADARRDPRQMTWLD